MTRYEDWPKSFFNDGRIHVPGDDVTYEYVVEITLPYDTVMVPANTPFWMHCDSRQFAAVRAKAWIERPEAKVKIRRRKVFHYYCGEWVDVTAEELSHVSTIHPDVPVD
jgi:hypothetical protein